MAEVGAAAQGWYWDPFHEHEDRYFSAGHPTKLVRDAGQEAFDPPPNLPVPGPLVPAGPHATTTSSHTDTDRAHQTVGAAYDRRTVCDIAIRAMVRYGAAR
jgi:hypothetical protein